MSEFVGFAILIGLTFLPFLLAHFWFSYKISKREDKPGDIIAEARKEGPAEMDRDIIEYKKDELERTERNILYLTERELLAHLGLARVGHLGVDEVRHEMGEPVVQVVIYENILKWYGIPVGFERTRVRHYDFEIEIPELDEIMGEPVVAVDDYHGDLKAMGISAYEEEEFEDAFGDTVRERVVREWVDTDRNKYGVEYTLKRERERVVDEEDVVWTEDPTELP